MIALDAALRRLTVCQLTGECAEMAAASPAGVASPQGGCWGQILPVWHEAHPKTTLYGVVFQKIEWASAPRHGYKKQRKRTNRLNRRKSARRCNLGMGGRERR